MHGMGSQKGPGSTERRDGMMDRPPSIYQCPNPKCQSEIWVFIGRQPECWRCNQRMKKVAEGELLTDRKGREYMQLLLRFEEETG